MYDPAIATMKELMKADKFFCHRLDIVLSINCVAGVAGRRPSTAAKTALKPSDL